MLGDLDRRFIARVVPWPVGQLTGYVNVHHKILLQAKANGKESVVAGKPFRDIGRLYEHVNWTEAQSRYTDAWYCVSLQSQSGVNSKGKPKAIRLAHNAVALKAIWIDIDVKEKGYTTLDAAKTALATFVQAAGLPEPTAVVMSGSGLHVYWISKTPMDPPTWRGYAEGLRARIIEHSLVCDAGLTTDPARLLRIPGTVNYKTDPSKPVDLLALQDSDYDFAAEPGLAILPTLAPARAAQASTAPGSVMENVSLFARGQDPAFAMLDPGDTLGNRDKVAPAPVFKACGFLRTALLTGGRDYDNPLWNLTTLCATFMEGGEEIAHTMSKGHRGYDPAQTQALYDRKVAEQRDRRIGYPSCRTIQGSGCTACATCPLYKLDASPLNIRPDPPTPAEITAAVTAVGAPTLPTPPANDGLPAGYVYNETGHICKVVTAEDEESDGEKLVQLFYSKLSDAEAYKSPDVLSFTTSTDKGHSFRATIKQEDLMGMTLFPALLKQKVKPVPEAKRYIEGFLMAWLNKIHEAQEARQSQPLGWFLSDKTGEIAGFAYGGKLIYADGTELQATNDDAEIRNWYGPRGDIQKWYDACKLLTDQKRPQLDAIIASSFAAPLVTFSGVSNVTLNVWGQSGAGKTSAQKVGSGVWGHAKLAKESRATNKGILNKMGNLRHLPIYWDEISTRQEMAKVFEHVFAATDGVEATRTNTALKQAKRGEWCTTTTVMSNDSLVDYINRVQKTHDAGYNRVFAIEIRKPGPNDPGMIQNTLEAGATLDQLERHYGRVGEKYARMLATKHKEIASIVRQMGAKVALDVEALPDERFWLAQVTVLLVGAKLANLLGANLDYPALEKYLYEQYAENRKRKIDDGVGTDNITERAEDFLTAYLKSRVAMMVWTDMFPGKGRVKGVNVLHGPPVNGSQRSGIQVHWSVGQRLLRFSRDDWREYLNERDIAVKPVTDVLIKVFGARQDRVMLGGGTPYVMGQEYCITLPVAPGSAFESMMYAYTNPVDTGGVQPTGIVPPEKLGAAA